MSCRFTDVMCCAGHFGGRGGGGGGEGGGWVGGVGHCKKSRADQCGHLEMIRERGL